jgi:hypothetical protein
MVIFDYGDFWGWAIMDCFKFSKFSGCERVVGVEKIKFGFSILVLNIWIDRIIRNLFGFRWFFYI